MRLFSPDSKFMRAMSMLGDLMLLNLAFLLCCLPFVTIGASAAALYTAAFRISRGTEGHVLALFFRAFRQNLRRGIPLWLLLALAGGVALLDIRIFSGGFGSMRLIELPFMLLFLLAVFTAGYAFPLLSQFDNTVVGTLKNALFLSLGYLPRTIAVTLLNVFPFALLFIDLYLFLSVGFIWVFLYFSASAYLNARLLEKVFAPYREAETDQKEDTP
ncbi:MAG: DUF624 domain-containing protein [Oscillospiraceae bacterium]|nr:DUF624 domain-containing protein [Oscillospiraceae bacterium]